MVGMRDKGSARSCWLTVALPRTMGTVSLRQLGHRSARSQHSFFDALIPYLGGKRRLCPIVFREIARVLPREHWHELTFLDGFLGGGSVSLYAKAQGFSVISIDIAARSIVIGEALIANSRVRFTRDDLARALTVPLQETTANAIRLVPAVFTENVGMTLDKLLHAAKRAAIQAKAALYRLLAIRVAMLAHPMSQVRPGTAHRASTGEWESITPSCLDHYVSTVSTSSGDWPRRPTPACSRDAGA